MVGIMPEVESIQVLLGDYHGSPGATRFMENVASFWQMDPGGVFTMTEPIGQGDTVILRGCHELWQRDGGVTWGSVTFITEFENNRLRRIEASMFPGRRPTNVQGILTPQTCALSQTHDENCSKKRRARVHAR